jgi:hypothetical protein
VPFKVPTDCNFNRSKQFNPITLFGDEGQMTKSALETSNIETPTHNMQMKLTGARTVDATGALAGGLLPPSLDITLRPKEHQVKEKLR